MALCETIPRDGLFLIDLEKEGEVDGLEGFILREWADALAKEELADFAVPMEVSELRYSAQSEVDGEQP